MKKKNLNEKYNIDALILSMYLPHELFDNIYNLLSDKIYEGINGFNLTCVERDDPEHPTVFYALVNFDDGLVTGVIKFDKIVEKATFEVEKEVLYTVLSNIKGNKISRISCIEFLLDNLDFDLDTVKIEKMVIVRDFADFNLIKHISQLNSSPNYELYLNEIKVKEPCYLIDKYFIRESGICGNRFCRMNKQNIFYATSVIGNLEMGIYNKTKEIEKVSHEYYIIEYNDYPETTTIYRTEVILNSDFYLHQYYAEKEIEEKGFFALCLFYDPTNIKSLFDFLSQKLIYFKHKDTEEKIFI